MPKYIVQHKTVCLWETVIEADSPEDVKAKMPSDEGSDLVNEWDLDEELDIKLMEEE